ncbi:GntR family transcriptional regulator [Stappia sp. P2PMeth1]|uniref:GntR family transcriptional regulator n=1 Tax=Stappia sp. P2PMeth1 TaxID=2003586 RepID=UPI001648B1A1|nr:GntR family transcriptional regulator [Stappia sp. P2PMeth1]
MTSTAASGTLAGPASSEASTGRRKTTSAQVVDRLRERILSGDLPEGAQLRQEKLASELGVSRVPVREALHQLEAEGLVTLVTHKGAVVSGLSVDDLEETYEIRAQLEGWLLEQAMPILSERDYARAEALVAEMESDLRDESWSDLNWRFHATLYAPANRPRTLELVHKLYRNAYRHFPLPIRLTGGRERMSREHRMLVELCRKGDVAAAREHLTTHILLGARTLISRLKALRQKEAVDESGR